MKTLKVSLKSGVELIINEVSDEDSKNILYLLKTITDNQEESKRAKVMHIPITYKMGIICLNLFDISAIAIMNQTTKKECNNGVNYA